MCKGSKFQGDCQPPVRDLQNKRVSAPDTYSCIFLESRGSVCLPLAESARLSCPSWKFILSKPSCRTPEKRSVVQDGCLAYPRNTVESNIVLLAAQNFRYQTVFHHENQLRMMSLYFLASECTPGIQSGVTYFSARVPLVRVRCSATSESSSTRKFRVLLLPGRNKFVPEAVETTWHDCDFRLVCSIFLSFKKTFWHANRCISATDVSKHSIKLRVPHLDQLSLNLGVPSRVVLEQ